jgi:hypothetical protein
MLGSLRVSSELSECFRTRKTTLSIEMRRNGSQGGSSWTGLVPAQ